MQAYLLPYNKTSRSARVLARALGIKRKLSDIHPDRNDIIINWGKSAVPYRFTKDDLNHPDAVYKATSKLATFNNLSDKDYIPDWTMWKHKAKEWINEGHRVYIRTMLTSHSGRGILIVDHENDLIDSGLYTKDTQHDKEYRFHIFKGEVIDIQEKRKKRNTIINLDIRNHNNGWVFCRTDINYPLVVKEACIDAVNTLGLDFGAVDVGFRKKDNKVFIFEINTAPGLEKTTILKYAQAIKEYLWQKI